MSTNVFESQDTNQGSDQNQQEQQPQGNVFADQLSTITNEEGKQKYDNVQTALEALKHSQQFIPTLQQEKAELEAQVATLSEQVAQSKGVQDVVTELTNRQNEQTPTQTEQSFSAEDLAAIVDKQLMQRSQADTQKANVLSVHETLKSNFGTEAEAMVAKKAQELGTTPAKLGELAADSPAMVLALFGTTAKQAGGTQSTYNFDNTPQQQTRVVAPEKSLMSGSTTKETTDFMKQIRDEVYKDFDVKI